MADKRYVYRMVALTKPVGQELEAIRDIINKDLGVNMSFPQVVAYLIKFWKDTMDANST